MPKLHPDGTLSLSSTEVKDLRASVYAYGRDIARDRRWDATLKLRAIRTVLVTLDDTEDERRMVS